jgi:hypothetical protein
MKNKMVKFILVSGGLLSLIMAAVGSMRWG